MNIISRYFPNKRRTKQPYLSDTYPGTLKKIEKKLDRLDAMQDKYAEIIYEIYDLIDRDKKDSYYLDKD